MSEESCRLYIDNLEWISTFGDRLPFSTPHASYPNQLAHCNINIGSPFASWSNSTELSPGNIKGSRRTKYNEQNVLSEHLTIQGYLRELRAHFVRPMIGCHFVISQPRRIFLLSAFTLWHMHALRSNKRSNIESRPFQTILTHPCPRHSWTKIQRINMNIATANDLLEENLIIMYCTHCTV